MQLYTHSRMCLHGLQSYNLPLPVHYLNLQLKSFVRWSSADPIKHPVGEGQCAFLQWYLILGITIGKYFVNDICVLMVVDYLRSYRIPARIKSLFVVSKHLKYYSLISTRSTCAVLTLPEQATALSRIRSQDRPLSAVTRTRSQDKPVGVVTRTRSQDRPVSVVTN